MKSTSTAARAWVLAAMVAGLGVGGVGAQDTPDRVLIAGARIFDGVSDTLIDGRDVLIEGNTISSVAAGIDAPEGTATIDAAGRVLMPGFMDMHAHLMFQLSFG